MIKSKFTQTKTAAASKTAANRTSGKPRKTETVVEDAKFVEAEPTRVEPDAETAYAKLSNAADEYFAAAGLPTWQRTLCSVVLGLVSYGVVAYYGTTIVQALALATALLTGAGLITYLVALVGMVLVIVAASTAGLGMYRFASKFEYASVKSRVLGWFERDAQEVSHA